MDALVVTFGGYGDSDGPASELNFYADAQAALNWLLKVQKLPLGRVLAHGLSIGAGVALALAEANPGLHAVVDQGFTTSQRTAR